METTQPRVQPQATLTVLERSRELHLLMSKVTLDENILPRVYRLTIGKPVTDHSQVIYESLAVANTLDLYDKDLTDERKKYQLIARRELTKLLASLRIMYSITEMDSEKMRVLLDKTIEVERLLKKWMESDRHRIGVALNIVKKDAIDTKVFDREITTRDLFETRNHVDFDLLIKDVRSQGSPAPINHITGKPVYIPPADSLNKAPVPAPVYVVKSEEERIADLEKSRFDLSRVTKKDIEPPQVVKTAADYAIKAKEVVSEGTREPVVITVRDTPIVVPDDRAVPDPIPDKNAPFHLADNVQIVSGTPEMITEDIKEEEKETSCPTQPNSSVPSASENATTSVTSSSNDPSTETSIPTSTEPTVKASTDSQLSSAVEKASVESPSF